MKRIINGKKYDTATATLIGEMSNGGTCSDFKHFEEDLYRKDNGEFFIDGSGGPLTCYAVHQAGNTTSGSRRITPLSLEEAKVWVEKYANEKYEKLFGAVAE